MKIALCGRFHTDRKHQGGSAEVFLQLAKELSKKNEVTLFGRGKPTQSIINMCKTNKIKYYYIPSDSYKNIALGPIRALRLLRKHWNNFDIIHTHTGSFAFASTFFRKKAKVITHVHQLQVSSDSSFSEKAYLHSEIKLLKFAAKRSSLVITVSDYMRHLIQSQWRVRRVISIPNGISPIKMASIKHKSPKDKIINLLYVGRIAREKNIDKIIKSLEYLPNNVNLHIIGDGKFLSNLSSLASTRIIFHGRKEGNALSNYYKSSDIFLLVSKSEGCPVVLLEAMSFSLPIVASNVSGNKEIIKDRFNGLLVIPEPREISKAVKELISNKRLSQRLVSNGKKEIKKYYWQKIAKTYQEAYARLLKS